MAKRDWYVAVGDAEGGALAFDDAKVYGPYTASQAIEAASSAPPSGVAVRTISPIRGVRFDALLEIIRAGPGGP